MLSMKGGSARATMPSERSAFHGQMQKKKAPE